MPKINFYFQNLDVSLCMTPAEFKEKPLKPPQSKIDSPPSPYKCLEWCKKNEKIMYPQKRGGHPQGIFHTFITVGL